MSAAMLAFLAASCTNEELVQEPMMSGGQPFTLSAEHGMASRTVLDGNQTHWSEGDQIYVSSADGSVYGVLTLKKGAGSDKAEFFGYVSGDPSKLAYTIFPAPKSGNVIDLSNYNAGSGQLDAPMIATFNPNNMNSVSFQNETALVKRSFSNLQGDETITIKGSSIGGTLMPYFDSENNCWELIYKQGGNEINIDGIKNNTEILIPIATSANQISNVGKEAERTGINLTVTIQEPQGTSVSETFTVDVANGHITNSGNNTPYTPSVEAESQETIADLFKAGGNITLNSDITLSAPLEVEGVVTLDLNGFKISADNTIWNSTNNALIFVKRGGKLTINDSSTDKSKPGCIDANGNSKVYAAVQLTRKGEDATGTDATLIVNGGELKGYYYGVTGNGLRHNTSICINGGYLTGYSNDSSYGVYHPQNGTLTITDGKLEGTACAVELRSGTMLISGGEFESTADSYIVKENNNGTTASGAAVAVSQHSTNHPIDVTINGGIFTGAKSFVEENVSSVNPKSINISINGGTFNGPIYSENCEKFISACTFTEGSVLNYLAKESNLQMDRNVTLTGGTNDYGNEDTKVITISGNNNTLTFVDSYRTYISNAGGKFVFNDVVINRETTSNKTHWHDNNMKFECEVEMNNVTFNKGITLESKATLNNVTINKNTVDTYAIFICVGADVTMTNGCKIITAADKGRGIKVTNEDVKDKTAETKINISNTSFETSKKAAITVESQSKTVITLGEKVDISRVKADQINAVWVHKDAADYYNLVEVTGGSKKQEE